MSLCVLDTLPTQFLQRRLIDHSFELGETALAARGKCLFEGLPGQLASCPFSCCHLHFVVFWAGAPRRKVSKSGHTQGKLL